MMRCGTAEGRGIVRISFYLLVFSMNWARNVGSSNRWELIVRSAAVAVAGTGDFVKCE